MEELTPEVKKLTDAFKELRFLIADPSSSRKSFRALLSELRVRPNQITIAEMASDAQELTDKIRPHVIIAESTLGVQVCLELLRKQTENLPTEPHAFFLVSTQNSNSLVTSAADENIDAVLLKPFTYGSIRDRLLEVMTQKLFPSPYTSTLRLGREALLAGDRKKALQEFERAKTLDAAPALACAQLGEIFQQDGDHEAAIQQFQEGLKFNDKHFRCLIGIVESHTTLKDHVSAYRFARQLVQHHTIPLKRIPEMIRLSVLNQQFEDVVGFYETTTSLETLDETLSIYLSAGLVICGLYFLRRKDTPSAISAFRKAEIAAKQQPRILKRILEALISAGLESEMKAFLSRVPDEVRNSVEIRIAQIESLEKSGSIPKALEETLGMLNSSKSDKLYEIAIRLSVKLGRKESLVEDLVWRAGEAFPDKRDVFSSLAARRP